MSSERDGSASGAFVFIGVDGGGTSTTTVAVTGTGQIQAQVTTGCTNKNSVGHEKARSNLQEGIRRVLQAAGSNLASVGSICMGMSSCNTPADAQMFRSWVEDMYSSVPSGSNIPLISAYNDSTAALASGTRGDLHGLVLIAGTGQITYGINRNNKKEWVAGGNGGIIDYGSGTNIGLDVLRAAFQAADGMGRDTPMLAAVLAHIKGSSAPDIVPWLFDNFTWGQAASVAPIAFNAANAGDPVAVELLVKHYTYLIRSAETVIEKIDFEKEENVTVVLAGGILSEGIMKEKVTDGIRKLLPNAAITLPLVDPAVGAALLGMKQYQDQ